MCFIIYKKGLISSRFIAKNGRDSLYHGWDSFHHGIQSVIDWIHFIIAINLLNQISFFFFFFFFFFPVLTALVLPPYIFYFTISCINTYYKDYSLRTYMYMFSKQVKHKLNTEKKTGFFFSKLYP